MGQLKILLIKEVKQEKILIYLFIQVRLAFKENVFKKKIAAETARGEKRHKHANPIQVALYKGAYNV